MSGDRELFRPERDGSAWRIDRRVPCADGVNTLVLEPMGAASCQYRPGQSLTLQVPVPAIGLVERSFALTSCPSTDPRPTLTINRGVPGSASHRLCSLPTGTVVWGWLHPDLSLCPDSSRRPLALFGAGLGFAPLLSIVKFALTSSNRPISVHYAAHDRDRAPFAEPLDGLQTEFRSRLRVQYYFSKEGERMGPADVEDEVDALPGANFHVCGPSSFVKMVTSTLRAGGTPSSAIYKPEATWSRR